MLYKCTKILKIIEQKWGKDSDLYGSAEEACIYGGYNALLKVLEDYDCMYYADDDYEPMSDDENMSYTYPTYPDDDNEPEPLDEGKKHLVKINEKQLAGLIKKSVKKILSESTSQLDKTNINKMADEQDSLFTDLHEFNSASNKAFKNFIKHLDGVRKEKAIEIFNRTQKQLNNIYRQQDNQIYMKNGRQPNPMYDLEHLTYAQRRKRTSPDPDEPQWHGYEYDD